MSKKEDVKLLQSVLKERDDTIKSLEEDLRDAEENIRKMTEELELLVAKQKEEKFLHEEKCEELVKERVEVEKKMHALEREMKQSSTLHTYAELLRKASPGSVDSTYVVRLQAQLCKSMHSMGMLENQMTIVKKNCNGIVKSLKDEISLITDEKCKVEVDIMNQLAVLDGETRDSEEEWKIKLEDLKVKNKELEEKVGPLETEEEEDECEEDSETDEEKIEGLKALRKHVSEMKADKEAMEKDLRKSLKEQREKLSKMKDENTKQVELRKSLVSQKKAGRENGEESDLTRGTEGDSDDSLR